jgi:hypothetical protein
MIKCIITKESSTTEKVYSADTSISQVIADNNINPSKSLYVNSTLVTNTNKTIGEYAASEDTVYITSVVKTNNN